MDADRREPTSRPASPPLEIRPLTEDRLDAVARVHLRAFPEAILTAVGHGAVQRYYRWLLTGPHEAQCVGAFADDELLGFSFGGRFHGSLSGYLRTNAIRLALALAVRPRSVVRLVGRFRASELVRIGRGALGFRPPAPASAPPSPIGGSHHSFGVLSVAVDPAAQGRGVGAALMREAEEEAIRRGYGHMHLTVHPENVGAVGFYEGLGWVRRGDPWRGSMVKSIGE